MAWECKNRIGRFAMVKSGCKVCVTGGAGYVGSWLVKKLLEKGHTVHATLRNLDEASKVGLLKSFPYADTGLRLFEADIYKPDEFQTAIEGCDFVFHVATPLQHTDSSQYKNTTEAAIAGAKSIAMCCVRSKTVRRLIYTASVVAASPLKDDGTGGFKDSVDESCWTPLNLSFAYSNDPLKGYTESKTLAEREILRYGKNNNGGLEVVTLACGLVGGDTLLSNTPLSVLLFISLLTQKPDEYNALRFLEELQGKVPVVHIDDVCEAHIFCMEKPSINGRFLCASSYVASAEMAYYYQQNYPEFHLKQEYFNMPKRGIEWNSRKLNEQGFEYKCDTKMILEDCIRCARKMGDLQQ